MRKRDYIQESKSFDEVADTYDVYRPSYPPELINTIISAAALEPESKLLEIGAGSGKASELFLERGYGLLCIEPGQQLAELGLRKHEGKRIEYAVTRFEDWQQPRLENDLVFSAQAFHWVPQPEGYRKCSEVLKPDGRLALFWNFYLCGDTKEDRELASICGEHQVFSFASEDEINQRIDRTSAEIPASGYFAAPEVYRYQWSTVLDADSFIGFLQTGSEYLILTEQERSRAVAEISAVIAKNGGQVSFHFVTGLFISAKLVTP
ncbi:class I SAM-dependent methyltransferase [Paenibacillus donghaensis]|nr:class I SAM-dependent methyltransferase [Paenibacillus donghaensis]